MERLLAGDEFTRSITMTARPPRPGEVDGVHYVFATPEAFDAAAASGELVEHALVHGVPYGTPRTQLRRALATGRDVLLQVDIQGAASIRDAVRGARFVFIAPESLDQLERRLRERRTDDAELRRRLESARAELGQQDTFDHVVVNREGGLEEAVAAIQSILEKERQRQPQRRVALS